jgi:pyruvate,water dikinase
MANLRRWLGLGARPALPFKLLFARFRQLIDNNTRVLQTFADAAEKLGGEYVFDKSYVAGLAAEIFELVGKIVYDLNSIADQRYPELYGIVDRLRAEVQGDLVGQPIVPRGALCIPFSAIDESQVNLVGGKSAHLGEIHGRLQIPMPPGFTVTTYAYLRVLEENRLERPIEAALERFAAGDERACDALQERLRTARIPRDVRRAIERAVSELPSAGARLYLAVRSSALGEDDDLSFAGQYRTLLQVRPDRVLDAYREVLASLYTRSAIAYRRAGGAPAQGLMAVVCMAMVRARAAGVLSTVDPSAPHSGRLLISATRGLANRAMAGAQSMSTYEVARRAPDRLRYQAAGAAEMVVGRDAGGIEAVAVPEAERGAPELGERDLARLWEVALRIERYFKQPQEIEWAIDEAGGLYVIQTRRLQVRAPAELRRELPRRLEGYPVLLERCGAVACRGVASGPVHLVADDADLERFPDGGVLVARRASPRFVRVMPRAAAILTDIGAPTGHMAALAREFRVPTIVDCGDATTRLAGRGEVTVDADEHKVYAGRVEELMQYQLVEETGYADAPEYRLLRRLLSRVTPLSLTNPQSDEFRVQGCRTVHDVIRFAHEKAVEEIISLHANRGVAGVESSRRLEAPLPLGLQIIDVGGGLDPAQCGPSPTAPVKPEAIRSAPMRALWEGLTTPGVWSTQPVEVDLGTFLSSAMSRAVTESQGRNLAVLSECYVNLSLNLGYHYNMVDAYLSDDREANHIYFRFLGGAADAARRARRASAVKEILDRLDFSVRQTRDLVVARLRKLPRPDTEERLRVIGRLIGYARQIDALMYTDEQARRYVDAFLRGDYSLHHQGPTP